jgi:hypothetical protein
MLGRNVRKHGPFSLTDLAEFVWYVLKISSKDCLEVAARCIL